jgi:hypothetical protein
MSKRLLIGKGALRSSLSYIIIRKVKKHPEKQSELVVYDMSGYTPRAMEILPNYGDYNFAEELLRELSDV